MTAEEESLRAPRRAERHLIRLQLKGRDASLDPECDIRGEHFPFSFFVQYIDDSDGASAVKETSPSDATTTSTVDDPLLGNEEEDFLQHSVEFRCDIVEGEVIVDNIVYHGEYTLLGADRLTERGATPSYVTSHEGEENSNNKDNDNNNSKGKKVFYNNPFGSYTGPDLTEMEEEVLDGVQSYLAERCVDDQLGEWIGQWALWVEQEEYELWLKQLYDYVAA